MRDSISTIKVLGTINATLSADNTPAAIDTRGYDSVALLIGVGVGGITFTGSNKIEFKVTHSDDDSSYSDVAAADVILGVNADASVGSGGIVKSLIAAHAAATVTKVGYIGGKRYLKVLADFSGTHGSGTPICVMAIGSHGERAPGASA
jgi:hypothetical protein